jgi:hypothetical protein
MRPVVLILTVAGLVIGCSRAAFHSVGGVPPAVSTPVGTPPAVPPVECKKHKNKIKCGKVCIKIEGSEFKAKKCRASEKENEDNDADSND